MKTALKTLANWLATLLVAPEIASFWLRSRLWDADQALEGSSQTLSLVPGMLGCYLRTAFLRRTLTACDASARVEFGVLFSKVAARLGRNCYLGPRCQIGWAVIEPDVLVAAGVHIPSGAHLHGTEDLQRPIREQAGIVAPVRIGAGTWIGANSVIMADVGRNCVIGAGSVVTRPIPDDMVAAGVPARVLRSRTSADLEQTGRNTQRLPSFSDVPLEVAG